MIVRKGVLLRAVPMDRKERPGREAVYFGTLRIPEGVSEIGERAFYFNHDLTGVQAGEAVEIIGEDAFRGGKNLCEVTCAPREIHAAAFRACLGLMHFTCQGDRLAWMGEDVFRGCRDLRSAVLCGPLSVLPGGTFRDCASLSGVFLPEGLRVIGRAAFRGCSFLSSLKLPDTVEEIGAQAFAGCGNLRNLVLPAGLKRIGREAFEHCSSLENIRLPEGVLSVGRNAFQYVPLRNLVIPDSVERMEKQSLYAYGPAVAVSGRHFLEYTDALSPYPPDMILRAPDVLPEELPPNLRPSAIRGFLAMLKEGTAPAPAVREAVASYLAEDPEPLWRDTAALEAALDAGLFSLTQVRGLAEQARRDLRGWNSLCFGTAHFDSGAPGERRTRGCDH